MLTYLYCGRAQAKISNVTPMDPKKANVINLKKEFIELLKLG